MTLDSILDVARIVQAIATASAVVTGIIIVIKYRLASFDRDEEKHDRDWLGHFQSVYNDFWSDDYRCVRWWISSDAGYNLHLLPALAQRVAADGSHLVKNKLEFEDSEALDKLDIFLSIIARSRYLSRDNMSTDQRRIYEICFDDFWLEKIRSREILSRYVDLMWRDLNLDRGQKTLAQMETQTK